MIFPNVEHRAASSYLRELVASDGSPATLRSYAYALMRWFRFLDDQVIRWERAKKIPGSQPKRTARNRPQPPRKSGADVDPISRPSTPCSRSAPQPAFLR